MRIKSLVVGYVFVVALFLFARRHPDTPQAADFHAVVDLTAGNVTTSSTGTRMEAPAMLADGLWTVDEIPAQRLIAPLVVVDVRDSVKKNPDYEVSVIDIAKWESSHGEIRPGSVVLARTRAAGFSSSHDADSAGYSPDAAKFLIEARNVIGLGTDVQSVDSGLSKDRLVYKYTLSRGAYLLENVADLDRAPSDGAVIVVAPPKTKGRANSPVRLLAMAR
jgi:kynurenine formamidase